MEFFLFITFSILIYIAVSYINYRIVNKFTDHVSLWENFIPIWSTYILAREVISKPLVFMLAQYVPIAVSLIVLLNDFSFSFSAQVPLDKLQEHQALYDNLKLVYSVAVAYFWGQIASALGKKRWLHWIFALLQIPLLVSVPIMAFDKSRPVARQ